MAHGKNVPRRFKLEIWQDGVLVDAAAGSDFAAVHQEAMRLALLHGENGHVEIRGAPADKLNDVGAVLGYLPN